MKKAFLFLALTAAVTLAGAQGKFVTEASLGTTSYLGYSGLSLMPDANKDYTTLKGSVSFGLRCRENVHWGLRYDASGLYTSAVATGELCQMMSLSLYRNGTLPLTERFDISLGSAFGASMTCNSLTLPGDNGTGQYFRWGLVCQLEVGINYNLRNNSFIGLRTGYSYGTFSNTSTPLPDGTPKNKLLSFHSLQTGITIGIKF